MSTLKVDNLQDTGGKGLYPLRAWVNFNGTSTVSIRDDGNISSITDNSLGNYTTNFDNSLASANYSVSWSYSDEINYLHTYPSFPATYNTPQVYTTSACKIVFHRTDSSGSLGDKSIIGFNFVL